MERRKVNNFHFHGDSTMGYKSNFPQLMRNAGFKLRQYRDGPLDWRLMGSYETDRILREQNFEVVDDALQHLSEAPLGTALETHILDSGIAKYFTMSQYAIQYLLCCRTLLEESVVELQEEHGTAQQEIAKLRKSLGESNNEIIQLHKKITQIETIREVVFPCHLCPKNFISNEALNIHIGRKHRVGTPTATPAGGGSVSKDRDNDMQLINTIKMELEIKQLKERLNAAERNIRERSGDSCRQPVAASPRQADQATTTIDVRNVGIQSNLSETKEKDELSYDSEVSERKAQLHGLAERLSSFETWQTQLKQSNDQFIRDINQKLEDLSQALEMSKREQPKEPAEGQVISPCLDDLERILSDKVAEIGKVSNNKLEEVVHHLEMGYKDKLEALERELKRLSTFKMDEMILQQSSSSFKIPKPVPKKSDGTLERIKAQVEREFLKTKPGEDTYSIEEPIAQPEQKLKQPTNKIQELPSRSSSGSHPTFTKPPDKLIMTEPKPKVLDATDVSESLSEEEVAHNLSSEQSSERTSSASSKPEEQVVKEPKLKTAPTSKSTQQKMLTRLDARKLVNLRLNPHGFSMNSKVIPSISHKRVNSDLQKQRNKFRLDNPRFYATRNRIRKFVEKLCSDKLPERAQLLLKSPIHSTGASNGGSMNQEEETGMGPTEQTSESQNEDEDATQTSEDSHSSSSVQQQQKHRNFKAQLEQMLAKPAARLASRPSTAVVQMQAAKPVPLPRKRVMFNTLGSSRNIDRDTEELK